MQDELKALHQRLGITFVFVTHDQNEALSMADRVALFNQGRVVQVGTPQDIYRRPQSRFVADFVGSSNVLPPEFVATICGQKKWASLRPEAIRISASGGRLAEVIACSFLGGQSKLSLLIDGLRIHALLPSVAQLPQPGDSVHIDWDEADVHLMDDSS